MNHDCNILAYRQLTQICASKSAYAIDMSASKHSLIVNNSVKVAVVVVAII